LNTTGLVIDYPWRLML